MTSRRIFLLTLLFTLTALPVLLTAEEVISYPNVTGGADILFSLKVENNGTTNNLFDELGAWVGIEASQWSRAFLHLEVPDLMGYNAGWNNEATAFVQNDGTFPRTLAYIESEVLEQAGLSPGVTPVLYLGYGSRQQALVQEFSRFRFERSGTAGIDGFDLSTALKLSPSMSMTAAFNPASLGASESDPDVFVAFGMDNDHRGSSWGELIHFTSSSMQLFYDSSANLKANRLYDGLVTSSAMTFGIGGTLALDFAGIDIFGYGMTEFFLMYDSSETNIVQAQWGAGFLFPVLAGIEANLSGSNAMFLSDTGDGSFMNFGLDMKLMFNSFFGWFGAVAGVGILDAPGMSVESGLCMELGDFNIYAGYSDHAIGTSDKYAKGAFDKTEILSTSSLNGGFFLTAGVDF